MKDRGFIGGGISVEDREKDGGRERELGWWEEHLARGWPEPGDETRLWIAATFVVLPLLY